MENSEDRWKTCLAHMQERCPNQELIDKVAYFQKKEDMLYSDTPLANTLEEEARSCCEGCGDYGEGGRP